MRNILFKFRELKKAKQTAFTDTNEEETPMAENFQVSWKRGESLSGRFWPADKPVMKLGIKNTRLLIYPGMRHEILNETGRMQVLQDILTFMKEAAS